MFKFLSKDIQSKITEVFTNNLKGFYENEILKNNTLIDMNKKYILLMLNFIKINHTQQPNKITIHEEISPTNQKNLITYEEIQNDRKSQFEKDLFKRQEEFTNSMTLKAPPVPEFNDKNENRPITEMEKIIKEMTAQRNYEVEEITRSLNVQNQDDNWLRPQETSIKNEKYQPDIYISQTANTNTNTNANTNTNTNTKLKYLKIENDEVSLNNFEQKRNVTWGENITKEFEENEIVNDDKLVEENIFKKLKRVGDKDNSNKNDEDVKRNIINITKRLSEMQEEMRKMQEFLQKLT